MTSGWDRPGGTWHWYRAAGPICGSDARLSLVTNRQKQLPARGKKCKRCMLKRGVPKLTLVKGDRTCPSST